MSKTSAWKILKVGIAVVLAGAAAAGGLMLIMIVVALFEINDRIDRCLDGGSGKFIFDDVERERQCRSPDR